MTDSHRIREIWNQTRVPVIYRGGTGKKLMVRLPFRDDNRQFLRSDKRNNPAWIKDKKYWECPASWFNDIVRRTLDRWGSAYVIQPYVEQEKCAPACWNAEGHVCQCSCMGANHGSQSSGAGWFVVSDTFATRWNNSELACRLMRRSDS